MRLEIYWKPHIERLGSFAGKALQGHLQDELFVLNGNIVYAESPRIQLVSAISLSMGEALFLELRSHVASQMPNPFVVDD